MATAGFVGMAIGAVAVPLGAGFGVWNRCLLLIGTAMMFGGFAAVVIATNNQIYGHGNQTFGQGDTSPPTFRSIRAEDLPPPK